MVNKIDEQSYITYMMRKLPDAEKGKVHKMEKGDNLWKLAKQELNKTNASNQEISEYMLLIAKLNNLETIEKMHSLKVSDEIYLPEKVQVSKPENASKSQTSAATEDAKTKPQVKQKPLTDAEQGFAAIKDALLNDKSIHVTQAYPRFLNLYHVYQHYENDQTGFVSKYHPVTSFTLDKQGKFKKASFEGTQDIDKYGYDYDVDKNGNIKRHNGIHNGIRGKVSSEDMKQVAEILVNLANQSVVQY